MNFVQTLALGAIAGFTIYIGLPLGRMKHLSPKVRTFFSMISAGIIFFLLFDMLNKMSGPILTTFAAAVKGQAPFSVFMALISAFIGGLGIGLLGLIVFEKQFLRFNLGTARQVPPTRLAFMIAVCLGLHNFTEGLAIGQSAGHGDISFAAILIIGFGLHNTTEGFSIVCPLGDIQPSWSFLAIVGLIAGGPTFLGTILGYGSVSTILSIFFLALASGALMYLLGELFILGRREAYKIDMGWGLFVGFLLAYLTDFVLIAGKL